MVPSIQQQVKQFDAQVAYREAWQALVKAEKERDLAEKMLRAAELNHDQAVIEHEKARSALLFAAREDLT